MVLRLWRAACVSVLIFATAVLADPTDSPKAVTFQKVLEFLELEVPDAKLRDIVSKSPTRFTLSPEQVEQLKQAGASEALIELMTKGPPDEDSADITSYVLILDCSNSMREPADQKGTTKFDAARQAANELIAAVPDGKELAVILYGYNAKLECRAVSTVRPISPLDSAGRDQLKELFAKLAPAGHTPIANSLKAASKQIEKAGGRAKIILITDGLETCKGDPEAEAAKLVKAFPQLQGGVDVIGYGLKPEEVKSIRKIATAGNGQFYDARTTKDLVAAVQTVKEVIEAGPPRGTVADVAPDKKTKQLAIPESSSHPLVEMPEVEAADAKPSDNKASPVAMEPGKYVSGRLAVSQETGKFHYYLVDVPAGEWKLVLDMQRADGERNANLIASLDWLNEDGSTTFIDNLNEVNVRARGISTFNTEQPLRRVLRLGNDQSIVDYQLALFPSADPIRSPFFVKPPPLYTLEIGTKASFVKPEKFTIDKGEGWYSVKFAPGDYRVTATGYYPGADGANGFYAFDVTMFTAEGGNARSLLSESLSGDEPTAFARKGKLSFADETTLIFRVNPFGLTAAVDLLVEPWTEE